MNGDEWQRNIFGETFPTNKSIQPKDNFPNWPLWESILKGEREDRVKTKRERFLAEAASGKKEDEQRFFQRARIFFLEDPCDLDAGQIETMKKNIKRRARPVEEKGGFGWGYTSVDLFRDSWILVVAPKAATLRQLIDQLSKNPKAVDKFGKPYSRAEYHDMIQQRLVVNANWLADCGRQKKLVHPRRYLWRTFKVIVEASNPELDSEEQAKVAKRMSRKRPRPTAAAPPPKSVAPQAAPDTKRRRIDPTKFACQLSGRGMEVQTPPCNQVFLKELKFLQESANLITAPGGGGSKSNPFREKAYKRAYDELRMYRHPLNSEDAVEEFCQLKRCVGGATRLKLLEIFHTGHCEKAECLRRDPEIMAKMELQKVWGIGPTTAKNLYECGVVGVGDLRKKVKEGRVEITAQQTIGLKHFEELLKKIPREEATAIGEAVRQVLNVVSPGAKMKICGSYRRGAPQCGDVDVLMCAADGSAPDLGGRGLFWREGDDGAAEIVARLRESGFLTDDLSLPDVAKVDEKNCYMGVCMLPAVGIHRRIDLKVYPSSLYPFALLYFTGSGHFNRSMRLYAKKMGYKLSDDGIVPRIQEKDCKCERDIFEAFGLEYRSPNERNCYVDVAENNGPI